MFRNELKGLLKHGSIYFLGTVLSRLVGFLMIPVYTHYLSTAEYGINEIVGITVEIIGIVLGLGIAGAIYRFYYEPSEDKDRNLVVSTACIAVPLVSFVFIGLLCFQSKNIAFYVLDGADQWIFITLALGTLWFNQQVNMVYTYLRVREFSGKYLFLSIAKLVTALSLNIYFIVFLEKGVLGLFIANIFTAAIFAVITYPFLLKQVGLSFSMTIAKKMLRFSLPIIPANLASLAVNASDRYFIKAFFSIADAGIYGLGYKFGNVVFYFIRVPFMQIWEPRRYALYNNNAPVEIYAKIATYFCGLMIFTGLGISVFLQDIIKIISPQEYWKAATYAPAVVLCYIIYAMDHHVAFGILIKKKTEYWTYVNLSMAVLNLALNFILIPTYGVWGAIIATFISLVYKVAALFLISRKLFYIPFEWPRMAGLLIIACSIYLLSILIHPDSLAYSFIFDSFMVLAYLLLLWISGIMTHDEKTGVIKITKSVISKLFVKQENVIS